MSRIDDYLKTVDEVIEKGRFKDNWESLSRFKTPSFLSFSIPFHTFRLFSVGQCIRSISI